MSNTYLIAESDYNWDTYIFLDKMGMIHTRETTEGSSRFRFLVYSNDVPSEFAYGTKIERDQEIKKLLKAKRIFDNYRYNVVQEEIT